MRVSPAGGVLCVGNICYDIPVHPVGEIEWGTSYWVQSIRRSVGGNGANTACTLGRLGIPVRLAGLVGSDPHGDLLLAMLTGHGVDASAVLRGRAVTSQSICLIREDGERLLLHLPGASREVTAASMIAAIQLASNVGHFHLANPFALPELRREAAAVLAAARDAGWSTSMDTGWDSLGRWMQDVGPCLPLVDLLFVNEREGHMLTGLSSPGDAGERLRSLGATEVVVKLGRLGCAIHSPRGVLRESAFSVPVIDTTGAGDSFVGGFLAARYRGLTDREAARFANAVAASCVGRLGSSPEAISFEGIESWIRQQP